MMRASTIALASVLLALPMTGCQETATAPASQATMASGFDQTLASAKTKLAAQMDLPLNVPVPKDPGGGYTHEQHKLNASLIYDAGQMYELTGDKSYAAYAAKLMAAYADVYPSWGIHPAKKEQSPGRMFWQNLNESMWLLNVSQAYDAVKETMSEEERAHVETNVLRNMADFLSTGSPETFDKIHNHGTWATAAVGLTGYAIGDKNYTEQALLGLDKSGNTGFIKQLDMLFSPDGYYNEGPYYHRFALMPFVVFGQAVQENEPERKIFEHRDGILEKATYTLIQLNYNGLFFPINDAIKDKGIRTRELLHGVAIAYDLTGDPGLLSIAKEQGKYVLTPESRKLADDLAAGKAKPFAYASMSLGDGLDGTEGALDILRATEDPKASVIVMKNTSQGLGHGHFDKMGFIFYDNGNEIISDYGAARFLNVEAKYGGHYLPENNKFAKQTIAHNALVVDETSHFGGSVDIGNKNHPNAKLFAATDKIKIAAADIDTAYPGVTLTRTMAMITDPAFERPIVVDLMKAGSDNAHKYDLPFYYSGQLIDTNFKLKSDSRRRTPLGTKNGYQYLWKTASAAPVNGQSQITWLEDRRFYTLTSSLPDGTAVQLTEVGANDPNFNLRREPAAIFRTEGQNNVAYASVIEPHGEYNPTVEYTVGSHSQVASVTYSDYGANDFILITTKSGEKIGLALALDADKGAAQTIELAGKDLNWTGQYKLFTSKEMSK